MEIATSKSGCSFSFHSCKSIPLTHTQFPDSQSEPKAGPSREFGLFKACIVTITFQIDLLSFRRFPSLFSVLSIFIGQVAVRKEITKIIIYLSESLLPVHCCGSQILYVPTDKAHGNVTAIGRLGARYCKNILRLPLRASDALMTTYFKSLLRSAYGREPGLPNLMHF